MQIAALYYKLDEYKIQHLNFNSLATISTCGKKIAVYDAVNKQIITYNLSSLKMNMILTEQIEDKTNGDVSCVASSRFQLIINCNESTETNKKRIIQDNKHYQLTYLDCIILALTTGDIFFCHFDTGQLILHSLFVNQSVKYIHIPTPSSQASCIVVVYDDNTVTSLSIPSLVKILSERAIMNPILFPFIKYYGQQQKIQNNQQTIQNADDPFKLVSSLVYTNWKWNDNQHQSHDAVVVGGQRIFNSLQNQSVNNDDYYFRMKRDLWGQFLMFNKRKDDK